MKSAALFFAGLGVLSGVIFWAGALWYAHGLPVGMVIGPLVTGTVVLVIHTLNIRKLRNPASRTPRGVLIGANLFLFAFCVLGLLYLVDYQLHSMSFMVCFGVVFVLPFAFNGIYFAALYSPHDDT